MEMIYIFSQNLIENDHVIDICFNECFEWPQQTIDLFLDICKIIFEPHDNDVPLFIPPIIDDRQFVPIGKFDRPLVEERDAVYHRNIIGTLYGGNNVLLQGHKVCVVFNDFIQTTDINDDFPFFFGLFAGEIDRSPNYEHRVFIFGKTFGPLHLSWRCNSSNSLLIIARSWGPIG